jgi:hypothetical protein
MKDPTPRKYAPILDLHDDRFITMRLGLATPNSNRIGEFMANPRRLNWDSNLKRLFLDIFNPICSDSVASSDGVTGRSKPYLDKVGETLEDIEDDADDTTEGL